MNSDSHVLQKILASANVLTGFSPVMHKIHMTLQDPDASLSEIVHVLQYEPVFVGKILRLANSASVGLPRSVSSLQNAVVLLGTQRIHALLIVSAFLSKSSKILSKQFSNDRFWMHSIYTALIGEELAVRGLRYEFIEKGDVFSACLLHDLGKYVLAQVHPDSFDAVCQQSVNTNSPFYTLESVLFRHALVGAEIARQWNFPHQLIQAMLLHHDPESAPQQYKKLVSIVHVSDVVAHLCCKTCIQDEGAPQIRESVIGNISVQPEQLRDIAFQIVSRKSELEALFAINNQ